MDLRFSPRSLTVQTLLASLLALIAIAQTTTTDQSEQQPPPRAVHSHRPVVRDTTTATNPTLCAGCVESNLSYLAGPTLHGRGSGTEDEHHAAQFIAGKLKQYGLQPAAGDGQFVQTGTVRSREVVGNPTLSVDIKNTQPIVLTHGKQIEMVGLSQPTVSGRLQTQIGRAHV